jgi:hypothetical protein
LEHVDGARGGRGLISAPALQRRHPCVGYPADEPI